MTWAYNTLYHTSFSGWVYIKFSPATDKTCQRCAAIVQRCVGWCLRWSAQQDPLCDIEPCHYFTVLRWYQSWAETRGWQPLCDTDSGDQNVVWDFLVKFYDVEFVVNAALCKVWGQGWILITGLLYQVQLQYGGLHSEPDLYDFYRTICWLLD